MSEHDEDAVVERCARARCGIEGDLCMSVCSYGKCAGPLKAIEHEMEAARCILAALKPGDRLPGGLVVVKDEPIVLNLADILAACVRKR